VKLTKQMIDVAATERGGYSRSQVTAVGVPWPLVKGWKKRLVGKEVSLFAYQKFCGLTAQAKPKPQPKPSSGGMRLHFGVHKGKRIRDVPDSWLEWWFYSHEYKDIPKFVLDEVLRRKLDVSDLILHTPSFVTNPRF